MKAGVAQRDITPPVGITIGHPIRVSIGVRDPLFLHAMVFEDGAGTSVAIVRLDLIGAGFEVCD